MPYNPSKRKVNELKRELANYNRRAKRAIKKSPYLDTIAPNYGTVAENLENIGSVADLNRRIKEIKSMRGKAFDLTTTVEGEAVTAGELKNIEEHIKRENRERRKREKIRQESEEYAGRFTTQAKVENRPITMENKTLEQLRHFTRLDTDLRKIQQSERWIQTYQAKLDEAKTLAIIGGTPYLNQIIGQIDYIKNIISGLNTLELATAAFYIPQLNITITSDLVELLQSLDDLTTEWESFAYSHFTDFKPEDYSAEEY